MSTTPKKPPPAPPASSDDEEVAPPPPRRTGSREPTTQDAGLERLSEKMKDLESSSKPSVDSAETQNTATPTNRDAKLKTIIDKLKGKLDLLWPQGIDAKTKLKWINADAGVAKKAYEVLNLPSNHHVVQGEAQRFNGDELGAREYIVLKARIKQRETLMSAHHAKQVGALGGTAVSPTGDKRVICEGTLTKMALSGKNSWKRRHFKLVYAPPPRYAGPYLQYFEDESNPKEKGRVQFQAGDMVELQSAAPKSSFGFALLAKTHEIKLKGYADSEEDLSRWVAAFNTCVDSFALAGSKK